MPASYPNSAKVFVTKSNGGVIDASHVNDLQLEVTAMEQDLIAGLPPGRGGTGVTTIGAAGTALVSNGAIYVATDVTVDRETAIIAGQVFS